MPMKPMDASKLLSLRRRYKTQKSLRTSLSALWDEIDYFTGPVKDTGSIAVEPTGGTGQNLESRSDLWDFTAIDGRQKLAASIYGSTCGNAYRFFHFGARDPVVGRDNEVSSWLSDRSEEVWNDVQDSDFNTEMPAALHELCGPGNCFLAMELIDGEPETYKDKKSGKEGTRISWEGVDFTAIPLRDCYFEPDRKNMVKTFWRRFDWMPSQVVDFCEDKGIPVPTDIAEKLAKGSDEKFEIVFAVFQRPEILKKKKITYPPLLTNAPMAASIGVKTTASSSAKRVVTSAIFKGIWARTPGSKWGHGPGNMALPTVKYVNAWKELLRGSGEKVLDPSFVATERNIMSDVDLKSAGITLVRDIDGIKPLESAAKFDVGEGMLEKDQKQIRDLFHVDELQMKDSPAMTATEAQIRYEWMMRLLGKTLAFIQAYLLAPVVVNILAMRIRLGACPPMPKPSCETQADCSTSSIKARSLDRNAPMKWQRSSAVQPSSRDWRSSTPRSGQRWIRWKPSSTCSTGSASRPTSSHPMRSFGRRCKRSSCTSTHVAPLKQAAQRLFSSRGRAEATHPRSSGCSWMIPCPRTRTARWMPTRCSCASGQDRCSTISALLRSLRRRTGNMTKEEMVALKIPEELHENDTLKEAKDVPFLGESCSWTRRQFVGSSIRIPGADAGEEDKKAFREKLKTAVPDLVELPADPDEVRRGGGA
jgi:hypothetical protein